MITLVVPPLFAHTLQHEPLCAEHMLIALQRPCNGDQAVEFYFRTEARFLLTASGSCSRTVHTSISPCARSLFVAGDRYLSLQCVIAIVCLGSVFTDGKAIKKPFIPHPGRRALLFTLVLPPAFTDISRYQPQQVCTKCTYFYPITGASGEFYSHTR